MTRRTGPDATSPVTAPARREPVSRRGCQGPGVEPALTGSRREAWLVLAASGLLVVLVVSATVFLVADTGSSSAVLAGVSGLVSVVALGIAYAGSVAARSDAVASAGVV